MNANDVADLSIHAGPPVLVGTFNDYGHATWVGTGLESLGT